MITIDDDKIDGILTFTGGVAGRAPWVEQKEGETLVGAVERTRLALSLWHKHQDKMLECTDQMRQTGDEKEIEKWEATLQMHHQESLKIESQYLIIANFANMDREQMKHDRLCALAAHRQRRALMSPQQLKESAEKVERMEAIYYKTH